MNKKTLISMLLVACAPAFGAEPAAKKASVSAEDLQRALKVFEDKKSLLVSEISDLQKSLKGLEDEKSLMVSEISGLQNSVTGLEEKKENLLVKWKNHSKLNSIMPVVDGEIKVAQDNLNKARAKNAGIDGEIKNIRTQQGVRSEDQTKELWNTPQIIQQIAGIIEQQSEWVGRYVQLQAQAQNSNQVDRMAKQIALNQINEQMNALRQQEEKLLAGLSPAQQKQVKEKARQQAALSKKSKEAKQLDDEQRAIQDQIKQHKQQKETVIENKIQQDVQHLRPKDKPAQMPALKQQAKAAYEEKRKDLQSQKQAIVQKKKALNDEIKNLKTGVRKAKVQKVVKEDASALIDVMLNDKFVKNVDRQTLAQLNSVMRNVRLNKQAKYDSLIGILAQADARKGSENPTKQQVEWEKARLNKRLEQMLHEVDQDNAQKWLDMALKTANPAQTLNNLSAIENNATVLSLAKSMLEAHLWAQDKQDMLRQYMDAARDAVTRNRFDSVENALKNMLGNEQLSAGALNQLVEDMVSKKGNAPVQQNIQDDVQALNGQQKQELADKLGVSVDRVEDVVSGKEQLSPAQLISIGDDAAYDLGVAASIKTQEEQRALDAQYYADLKRSTEQSLENNYKVDENDTANIAREDLSMMYQAQRALGERAYDNIDLDSEEKRKLLAEDMANSVNRGKQGEKNQQASQEARDAAANEKAHIAREDLSLHQGQRSMGENAYNFDFLPQHLRDEFLAEDRQDGTL
jgi:predicted  nucleic acid-binding Zn-ribbon protein